MDVEITEQKKKRFFLNSAVVQALRNQNKL